MSKGREKKSSPYRPVQVPDYLYEQLEQEASERRTSGEDITWSWLVREIIEKHFKTKEKPVEWPK